MTLVGTNKEVSTLLRTALVALKDLPAFETVSVALTWRGSKPVVEITTDSGVILTTEGPS